jgi:MOSC domain-containing protein YiiM
MRESGDAIARFTALFYDSREGEPLMSGIVRAIYRAPAAGEALTEVGEVRALPGVGLEGDRYALGLGSFSRWPGTGRAVTLIEQEVIDAVLDETGLDLDAGRSRRNIVMTGVKLNELVGCTFRIGTAVFRGERLAEPCGYLERRIGPGLMQALAGRGGLRADVLEAGVVRVGDPLVVLESRRVGREATR